MGLFDAIFSKSYMPVDTGRKLNVRKNFRRCPGPLLNFLCTFNLRPVSARILFLLKNRYYERKK